MLSGTFWDILEYSGTFWIIWEHSGTFLNILDILEHSSCMLEHFACILEHFAYILEHSACILEHSACNLEHSGTFCYYIKCCKKVEFQLDDTQTHRHTKTQTLGLVELHLCR